MGFNLIFFIVHSVTRQPVYTCVKGQGTYSVKKSGLSLKTKLKPRMGA